MSTIIQSEQPITPKSLVSFLKNTEGKKLRGLHRLKIVYRPLICPFHEVLPLIPQHARVFDLGYGSGTFLRLVAELRNPIAVGGVEVSADLNRTATSLLRDCQQALRLEVYDGQTIPEWIADYDCITLIDVLHHVPAGQQTAFLRSLYKAMRPGSQLILKDIDAGRWLLALFNKLHDFAVSREIGHELSAEYVLKLVKSFGFEIELLHRKRMLVYPHFTLICRKPSPAAN